MIFTLVYRYSVNARWRCVDCMLLALDNCCCLCCILLSAALLLHPPLICISVFLSIQRSISRFCLPAALSYYYFYLCISFQFKDSISMASASDRPSTSTSTYCSGASTSYTSDYDVFINHRGPDVKNTFASHLYHRLISTGLRVFLDKPELVEGEPITSQIEDAIESASIHIAIFSPHYAQSKWCLDELVLMKLSGATILPVFYNVKPSQLRWTGKDKDGGYAEALRDHEKKQRYDPETIQNWKDALSTVAETSGFELEAFNRDEGLLTEEVVRRVMTICEKTPLKYVAEHPTGLKEKLQEFERTVLLQQKAKVVGIVGPGGIGKTTMAKEFFNNKRSQYDRSCFLSDIRENAGKGSLNSLQRKLLHDMTQLNLRTEFYSIDEGIEKLRKHLVSARALIILDDVDHVFQLEAFLPIKDILSSDSLILVTSRDKHVLRCWGVLESSIYRLKGLNRLYSKELFCCYAFCQRYPLPEFADLVESFLEACDGVPLSLKVFGALVCGETDRSYWQEILNGLNNILPTEIQERLRISYYSLSSNDQKIFLDIACFFIREDRDTVRRLSGLVGLRNLENKCLLEVDSENKIKMHDHIRDLGRIIAEEGSNPRRLWHHPNNNLDDLLEESSHVSTQVRGIATVTPPLDLDMMMSSDMSWYKRWSDEVFGNCLRHLFNNFRFCGILNLHLVATEDSYVDRILSRVRAPHLTWLRWCKCPYTGLPSWIPMENLRVLQVAGGKLKKLWQRESQAPLLLLELNIYAPLSGIPKSIGQLKQLEKIVISHALLETLPEEFCDLRSLVHLELRDCSKMKSLPDSLGKLTGLQHIDLKGASVLEMLPNSFGNLSQLKHLSLRGCCNLTISNVTLGNIRSLQLLDLSHCSNVKELPPQIANQRFLEKLDVSETKLKDLPSGIGDLCQLEAMELGGERLLEMLPPLLGCLRNLKELWLSDCQELKCLPDRFGWLTQLTELRIFDCGIEYLPEDLLKMNNLETLEIKECPLLELPFKRKEKETPFLLKGVRAFNDKCMFGLKYLLLFQTNLSELCFPPGVCPNLEELKLSDCKELRQIKGLGYLAKLRVLWIEYCDKVEEISELSGVKYPMSLEYLLINGAYKLRSIRLGQLTKLQSLYLLACPEIQELAGVELLTSLENLDVYGAHQLRSIQGLGQLTKLRSLKFDFCHEMQELPGLEHVMSLKLLWVYDSPKLQWGEGVVEQLSQRLKGDFNIESSPKSYMIH